MFFLLQKVVTFICLETVSVKFLAFEPTSKCSGSGQISNNWSTVKNTILSILSLYKQERKVCGAPGLLLGSGGLPGGKHFTDFLKCI